MNTVRLNIKLGMLMALNCLASSALAAESTDFLCLPKYAVDYGNGAAYGTPRARPFIRQEKADYRPFEFKVNSNQTISEGQSQFEFGNTSDCKILGGNNPNVRDFTTGNGPSRFVYRLPLVAFYGARQFKVVYTSDYDSDGMQCEAAVYSCFAK